MCSNNTTIGYYSSYETFGAVDGPGVRFVLFLQGCLLKCKYCHNPETIAFLRDNPITVDEVIEHYKRNISFYKEGGITCSGGEPTAQIDFLIDLFRKAKEEGIHTCVDTCLGTFNGESPTLLEKWDKLIKLTDLFICDVKHTDNQKHIDLTTRPNENILEGIKYIDSKGTKTWIRHVLVPGYTDDDENLNAIGEFIAGLKNMERFEILPYHNMMIPKYENLKMKFYLKDVEPPSKEYVQQCKAIINKAYTMRKELKEGA
ncbi:pyruvate formate-lyase-activating protein [Spiroplasma endosymbiont of Aspidapion aeneum]|uniref:pyruvate formate-lyase-activating protein n=1 Tax=Spiroplasma endosymbiont of Aspidapion aeneum TaxID=3066276 RepID=UPI00313ABD89